MRKVSPTRHFVYYLITPFYLFWLFNLESFFFLHFKTVLVADPPFFSLFFLYTPLL
ncbi:hypothetical protein BDC45DRAFT_196708 [Circinella umbellata]|nr:hypothetical protein BDC45DRAFT_196708 [Circinella umbellata]